MTEPSETSDPRYQSRAMFLRLWRGYLRKHLPWIGFAMIFMVLEGGALGVLSYMLKPMFDLVFVGGRIDAMWWVGGTIFFLGMLLMAYNVYMTMRKESEPTTAQAAVSAA